MDVYQSRVFAILIKEGIRIPETAQIHVLLHYGAERLYLPFRLVVSGKRVTQKGGITMRSHTYLAIDLKSFYASVECRERRLDPLDTHLVVADETRTDKTICLAVTPSLKSYGISGRGRLFEVRQRVKQVNAERQRRASGHTFTGASYSAAELRENPSLAMDFIIAPPHMAHYMAYSSRIYAIYMKYVAPEDMVVYSIDEVFMDVTGYLQTYGLTARELARKSFSMC